MVDPVTGAVLRPNGQAYHPRRLADGSDVDALRKLRAAGVSVLLYGPPGTGKTSVIEGAFPDLLTVAGDGDTTVADLVGEYTQTPEGRYVFVHGPLVRAMREGRALLLDDATLIPPSVLAVAYPAMDGRREIVVKANGGEIVTAQPGFYAELTLEQVRAHAHDLWRRVASSIDQPRRAPPAGLIAAQGHSDRRGSRPVDDHLQI